MDAFWAKKKTTQNAKKNRRKEGKFSPMGEVPGTPPPRDGPEPPLRSRGNGGIPPTTPPPRVHT